MLKNLFRALAVALLVLAVPVQGFAAASAGVCMAFEHHGDAAPAHDHGAGGDHHHAADDHHGGDSADSGHCAPCVSCCAAVAMGSYPPLALPAEPAGALVPAPMPSFSGIAPQILDRPPLPL